MNTPGQNAASAWNERMRMIRLRRKKERPRFTDEIRIIPKWLVGLCISLYLIAILVAIAIIILNPEARPYDLRGNVAGSILAVCGLITAISFVFSCFLFMLGYVYRDARRRDMNAPLWTLLVFILSPSSLFIGLIIYLLVREPLPYPCPRCAKPVGPRFNFCPNCKCDLHPSCPNCKREIAETDTFCPYCATELKQEPLLSDSSSPLS